MPPMTHHQQTNLQAASSIPRSPVILQIIPELGPGGAEQGCLDIAAELVRAGSVSIVVYFGNSKDC